MKYFILSVTVLLVITSCNQKNEELTKVNRERDSLLQLSNEREQSINEFITSFNEVERNLDSVAAKQQFIYLNSDKAGRELKKEQKKRINEEIASINDLMKQNRETIADLKRRLKGSSSKNRQLEKTITTLNNQLMQKETELSTLNERLSILDAQVAQLQTSVDTLTAQNAASTNTIAEKTAALHTAYYVIGKTKDLEQAKLIDRKGGLLGIGKTPRLNEDFDKSKFTQIDYTQIGSIAINSNDAKLITAHPSDSYTFEKDKDIVKNLVITNPEKFWSASKYLVIVKKS